MGSPSQARAISNYRRRLNKRGMARFEVLALKKDRDLVRAVARRLAENTPDAEEMRASMRRGISEKPGKKGGVLAALRRWPIADLDLIRPYEEGREIDL